MQVVKKLITYLIDRKSWVIVSETDEDYIIRPEAEELRQDFEFLIRKKISFNSDVYYLENVIANIMLLYPRSVKHHKSVLRNLSEKNRNQVRKFLLKNEWILPEEKSR